MHDLSHRAAIAVLLLAGVLTGLSAVAFPVDAGAQAGGLWPVVLQGQVLVAVLGAGLVLAAFVPRLRLATVGAAIVGKAGLLLATLSPLPQPGPFPWFEAVLLALLLAAAAVLARQALQQARWDGVLPLRQEG